MGPLNTWLLDAAGQAWLYPVLLAFFVVDGFATILPSETAIVALAALSAQSGQPNLWALGATALVGAIIGDNLAYLFGRTVGTERWKWMRRPRIHRAFEWARAELDKRGATLIFTARYIPWGRVAVNYIAGQTRFSHARFILFDAFACATWVAYSIGIGLFAGQWVEDNPLLGILVAIVFAVVVGFLVDRGLRLWERRHHHQERPRSMSPKSSGEPGRPARDPR